MSLEPSQKRHGYRFLAGLKATLKLGTTEIPCLAVDLHRSGVMLEGTCSAVENAIAVVVLESASEDLRFEGRGHITHLSLDEETGHMRLGIHFESLSSGQTETLEFLVARVIEGMNPAPLAHLSRNASIEEIRDALDKIPTANKITVAQRALPLERGFLLHDDNSLVIEALCRNPQLTMPDIVRVLRIPTLLPTTLELLSRNSRWTSNEEIAITIATHPRVTFPVADRLVKTLSLLGIRKVIRRPGLHPAIKDKLVQSIPHKQLQGW